MVAVVDITGQKFGRLEALGRDLSRRGSGAYWSCRCECGSTGVYSGKHLRSGNTKSCGCLNSDVTAQRNKDNGTHRMTRSATFTAWVNMKQRCTNPHHKSYHRYGGRGINVCDRWLNSFEAFLEDMGQKPAGSQLDRKDNDKGYEPGNCRWVTAKKNMNNREVCRFLEFQGRRQTIAQWSEELGCSRQALRHRINNGWSVEDALTIPFNHANCWRKRK